MKRIMIFAGEASGDLQGARLAHALKKHDNSLRFSGVGGPRMKEEGIETLFDSTSFGVIGAVEGLLKLPQLLVLYHKTKQLLLKTKPDLVIYIDTPAFNMRLAHISKEMGIKSVYYFPPSAWSGSVKRASEIASIIDHVITTFKFTADTYNKGNVPHQYFGHPLIDVLDEAVGSREEMMKLLKLEPDKRYIAILPGSRSQEIRMVLPLLIKSAEILNKKIPGLCFLMPVAAPVLQEPIDRLTKNAGFSLKKYSGMAPKIMSVCDLAIMASGSASLEASVLGVPMILTYRIRQIDWLIIKRFVRQKWCGLPNLILERDVVPELLQDEASPDNISRWAEALLLNEEKRNKMINDLREVKESLGEYGVTDRVAQYIWESVLK